MGHVKVVRRSMSKEDWIELRLGWLKRHIETESAPIEGWEIREARQTGEMEYEFYDADWRALNTGDSMFTPDGTVFLRTTTEIPPEFAGKKVWLGLQTASEMIVKINGAFVGGIDPNRDRFELPADLTGPLHIEIEAYNRSKPDDDRHMETRRLKGCRQTWQGARFVVLDEEVLAGYYDAAILFDLIISEAFDEDLRARIGSHLDVALRLEDIAQMRAYLQKHVFEDDTYRGSGKVALVAHSHLDIAYFWRRIHSVQKNARTCLIQMRLMDKYPELKYAHTQPFLYESLEKYYPDLFEELREKVRGGQFELCGAMYVEPDCNVPCAESLVRQCLYGQNYYREKFGQYVENCWLPDVFGNSWILPQILKKSGVKYFVSNKMSTWNDTNRFPHNSFRWRGIDGSEVFACVPPTHFITQNAPEQPLENWLAYQDKDAVPETLCMFGYGDGGSGVTEEMLEYMRRFERLPGMPKTRHITGARYLAENFTEDAPLETWDGELYLEMHRGTFTTKADLKKHNRRLEFKLRDAEMLCGVLYARTGEYPGERLRELYKRLLVNQFHDILPGSHIAPVYRDAMVDYALLHGELDGIITGAMQKLGLGCVNTLPWARGKAEQSDKTNWFSFDGQTLQTPLYQVSFGEGGEILSLYDIERQREWVQPGGAFNRVTLYSDTPGNYDAWDILPDYKSITHALEVVKPLELVEQSGDCLVLQAAYQAQKSHWAQRLKFYRASGLIDIENDVCWQEDNRLAKALFDVNVLARTALCDTSAGVCARETHRNTTWQQARYEVCQHKFTDISEDGCGVALLNEGKYGISLEGSTMGLSLLRATQRPDVFSDRGEHSFSYAILPHGDDMSVTDITKAAWEYNIPIIGKGEAAQPFTIDHANLFLQAVKKAENADGLVLRLCEQAGRRGRAVLKLPFDVKSARALDLLERPCEGSVEVLETNGLAVEYRPFEIISIGVAV